jgi:hypothetical protein
MSIGSQIELQEGQVWNGNSHSRWGGRGPDETRKLTSVTDYGSNEGDIEYCIVESNNRRRTLGDTGMMTLKSFRKWAEAQVTPFEPVSKKAMYVLSVTLKTLLSETPAPPENAGCSYYDLEMGERFFFSYDGDLRAFAKLDDNYVWDYQDQMVIQTCDVGGLEDSAQLIAV